MDTGIMSNEGFFHADGDTLVPSEFATSPWGPVLHGRLIGGLAARAGEQARAADPELLVSRLTVDMFRSAALTPLRVAVRPVRAGRRISVLEVTVEQDDRPIGQGKIVLLRRTEQPPGTLPEPPVWDAPAPPELGPTAPTAPGRRWTPAWEVWRMPGPQGPDSPAPGGTLAGGIWMRETHPLITGEPLTPLVRVAMAADMVSPVANSSDEGLGFINADYTIYLGREPEGEYVGIQPSGHISDRGVAAGQGVLHDERGAVGFVTTTAVANPPMGSGGGSR
jgi:hypothetical protein